jgi:hypothetical protein
VHADIDIDFIVTQKQAAAFSELRVGKGAQHGQVQ